MSGKLDPAVAARVIKALNFDRPDRPPVWESLQNQAVYDYCAPGVEFPRCAAIACERLGIDATYGCMDAVREEKVQGTSVHAAQTVWNTVPAFASLAALRAYRPRPVPEAELEEQMLEGHFAIQKSYAPRTMYLPQTSWGFLPGYDSLTFEVFAEALAEAPDALATFWDICAERATVWMSVFARHRLAPVIQICEDLAYKNGPMLDPRLLRKQFFPRMARVIAPLKEAGIKVVWHSDGNIMPLLADAVAIGIEGINPVDPSAGMDLAAIRRLYPRLILVGNVGVDQCLRFGTPDQVRADVRRCLRDGAGGSGGLLLQAGDGQIMPDVPLENVLAYLDEAVKGGRKKE